MRRRWQTAPVAGPATARWGNRYTVVKRREFRCWGYAFFLTQDYLTRHAADPVPPDGRRIPPVHSVVVHLDAKGHWNKPTELIGLYQNGEKVAKLKPPAAGKVYRGGFTIWDLGAEDVSRSWRASS